ncbi:21086_t:CDS:2, partial [Dentiscutata erythropus]
MDELNKSNRVKYVRRSSSKNSKICAFEKLAESITPNPNDALEDDLISIDVQPATIVKDISIIAYSPGKKFIAGWCKDDGILAVWSLVTNDSSDNDFNLMLAVKTRFDQSDIQDSKIYLSISEDGYYVAISRLKIISVEEESPDMDPAIHFGLMAPDNVKSFTTPITSFAVYSSNFELPHIFSGLKDLEILGPLLFIHDSKFVFFTRDNLYICTTKFGTPICKVYLGELIKSVPGYSHENNLFLIDCYDILSISLKTSSGYMLWPENNGLSIWNLDGVLKQWFYVDTKHSSPKDCLYAISESGELIARFSHKPGMVNTVIFHTPSGLRTEINTPNTVFFIAFLSKHDQIVVCSTDSGNVRVQLWDCWSGILIKEENHPNLDMDLPLLFLDDQFIHTIGNKVVKYPLFPNNNFKDDQMSTEELLLGKEQLLPNKKLKLVSSIEPNFAGNSICSICIHKKEKTICKFKFEPWRKWETADLFMKWLDKDGHRILLAGHNSIQIYKTKPKDLSYDSHWDIYAQLKKLILHSIDKFPSSFNKISLGDDQYIYPMEEFILFKWDNIVDEILKKDHYIPLFHNEERTESALALLIKFRKSELIDHLISYIIRHVHDRNMPSHSKSKPSSNTLKIQQLGFAWTVSAILLDLYQYYPDKCIKIMKEWSYFTTSLETPTRTLQTDLGDPSKIEERSFQQGLKAVSQNLHLPKEPIRQSMLNRIISKFSFGNKHSTNSNVAQTTSYPARLCVVPLPDFCIYPAPPKLKDNAPIRERIQNFWETYVSPKRLSPFAEAALHGRVDMFSEVAMEAIIKFKCIYPILVPDDHENLKLFLFGVVIAFSIFFLIQEIRQMLGRWKNYWRSIFNYLDLASFSLPLVTCSLAISKNEPDNSLKSYAILVVWMNMLLLSRAFAGPGMFISIILEIIKRNSNMISNFFLTLTFMVVSFANALFVLIRDNQDLTIPHLSGIITNSTTGQEIGHLDLSQPINLWWSTFPWAIFSTYKFLGVGWESVTVFDPEWALLFMIFLFSLIIEVFSGSLKNGRPAWQRHRAQLITEIELYSFTPSQRYHAEWFPHLIYYESHLDSILEWRQQLHRAAMDDVNADFIKNELKEVKSDIIGELKEFLSSISFAQVASSLIVLTSLI